jgi:hypothetical protein
MLQPTAEKVAAPEEELEFVLVPKQSVLAQGLVVTDESAPAVITEQASVIPNKAVVNSTATTSATATSEVAASGAAKSTNAASTSAATTVAPTNVGQEEAVRQKSVWKSINRIPISKVAVPTDSSPSGGMGGGGSSIDDSSWAGRVLYNIRGTSESKLSGHVIKREAQPAGTSATSAGSVKRGEQSKLLFVSQLAGVTDSQVRAAVEQRLKGTSCEGRVVRIERMKNGSAGFIELDSHECVDILLKAGLCLNDKDVRIDHYRANPRFNRNNKPRDERPPSATSRQSTGTRQQWKPNTPKE